jgi:hypothetical protein
LAHITGSIANLSTNGKINKKGFFLQNKLACRFRGKYFHDSSDAFFLFAFRPISTFLLRRMKFKERSAQQNRIPRADLRSEKKLNLNGATQAPAASLYGFFIIQVPK